MNRTACTQPQCLYSTAIPQLPYEPYGLYRASVPVQGRTVLFTYYFYNRLVTVFNVQMVTNTFRVYRVLIQLKSDYGDGGHLGVTQSPPLTLQHGRCVSNFSFLTHYSIIILHSHKCEHQKRYRYRSRIYMAILCVEHNQQDATFHNLFISLRRSTCFRRVLCPSSGAQNCTYKVRYLSDRYCYLLLAVQAIST